jgi:hypothetical protein
MFGRILVPDETGERTLIPEVALQRDMAGSYVLTVDAQNTVVRRPVALGPQVGTNRIIREGLEPDERVIVIGVQRAIPGNEVAPEAASASSEQQASAPAPPTDASASASASNETTDTTNE